MVTKEQILQQVFEELINPAVACHECSAINDDNGKYYSIRYNYDGTAVVTIEGIEYKIKMALEIISERKVDEVYKRAETPKQLIEWVKASYPDIEVDIFTAQRKLQEFNELMASLEGENASTIRVDECIGEFVSHINDKDE